MKTRVSIVLPFYNEERNVERVVLNLLAACRSSDWDCELVCVQNGSRDKTGEILRGLAAANPEVHAVEVAENHGYGFGIRQGMQAAVGEIVGYLDGDEQVSAPDVLQVLDQMRHGRAAKAVRVWRKDTRQRRMISWCYNSLFRALHSTNVRDANAKPKFLRRNDLAAVAPVCDDWFIDAEIMLKAMALGIVWAEVPVQFQRRSGGKSNVGIRTIMEFCVNLLRWQFGRRLTEWKTKIRQS